MGTHEIIMTVGLSIPVEPEAQVNLIARLDDAGLAGMMIGDNDIAPPITKEMLNEASRRNFPLMLVAEPIPFAAVARHVAAATSSSQLLQVLKLGKLYQLAANIEVDPRILLADIATLLRVDLRVEDRVSGMAILETAAPRSLDPERQERKYRLKGSYDVELQVYEYPGEPLDSFILVHLMQIVQVHADRVIAAADVRARAAMRTLAALFKGQLPADTSVFGASAELEKGFHFVAFSEDIGEKLARIVALMELPVLVGSGNEKQQALVAQSVLNEFREIAETLDAHFAASSAFADYRDVPAAAEEASRVLAASKYSDRSWAEFQGATISLLSRSHSEAETIVLNVLGVLAEPTPAAEKLRETLFAYLRNDRRWKETANELGIHRQTLSYRLGRIEEVTRLSIARSSDLSAFWIAYQAWEMTNSANTQRVPVVGATVLKS
jgi:purine catabolism regulator